MPGAAGRWRPTPDDSEIVSGQVAWPCRDDEDCSLNGVCTDGRCVCDAAWGGESGRCDELQFEPASFPQGYGLSPPLNSSWGGNPV